MSENRREARYPARIVAHVFRRGEEIELLTNDVSYRGAFLRTDSPPALRQLVRVTFALPTGETVGAHAMVVHVIDKAEGGEVPGVGLQFWGPMDHGKSWEQFVYDLKVKERAGVPSARAADKVRRASERFKLALDVDLGGTLFVTRDVSFNGMAIRTGTAFPVGTRVNIKLRASGFEPLAIDVVVRRKIDESGFKGIGVEFVEMTDAMRDSLMSILKTEFVADEDAIYVDPDDPDLH